MAVPLIPIAVSGGRIIATLPAPAAPILLSPVGREGLQHVLEELHDAAVIADAQGQLVAANQAACRLFAAESLIGISVDELLPAALRDAHKVYRRLYQAAPEARSMRKYSHLWARALDGRDFCVQVQLTPFATSPGIWTAAEIVEVGSGIA